MNDNLDGYKNVNKIVFKKKSPGKVIECCYSEAIKLLLYLVVYIWIMSVFCSLHCANVCIFSLARNDSECPEIIFN